MSGLCACPEARVNKAIDGLLPGPHVYTLGGLSGAPVERIVGAEIKVQQMQSTLALIPPKGFQTVSLYKVLLPVLALLSLSGCVAFPITDGFHHGLPEPNSRIVVWGNSPVVSGATVIWLQKRGLKMVERAKLLQIFEEQRIRLTHTPEDEAPVLRVGRLLGAGMIVFADGSSTSEIKGDYQSGTSGGYGDVHTVHSGAVTIRGVDVESGEVLWSGTARYARQYRGSPEDVLMKLTCQALATAWGFRPSGQLEISSEAACAANKPIILESP